MVAASGIVMLVTFSTLNLSRGVTNRSKRTDQRITTRVGAMNERERKDTREVVIATIAAGIWMAVLYLALTEYALWRLG